MGFRDVYGRVYGTFVSDRVDLLNHLSWRASFLSLRETIVACSTPLRLDLRLRERAQ